MRRRRALLVTITSSRGCDPSNTCRSGWPSYMADTTFLRNRKMGTLAYLYDMQGELYWGVDEYEPEIEKQLV